MSEATYYYLLLYRVNIVKHDVKCLKTFFCLFFLPFTKKADALSCKKRKRKNRSQYVFLNRSQPF